MEVCPLNGNRPLPEADGAEGKGTEELILGNVNIVYINGGGGMKVAILIIGVLILMGCAQIDKQTDAPVMPRYSTDSERVCGRSCQGLYVQCNHGCSQFPVSDTPGYAQRVKCFNNCNQTLKDCYSSCEKAP